MRVRGLMKTPVTTVDPDDSLHIADGIMSMGGTRHLPVVRGSALVGIVTQRDILRAYATTAGADLGFSTGARTPLTALSVGDVMTRQLVTIGAGAMVQEAADLLLKHRVGCLPVLERGALVGIVTTSDLLRAIVGPYRSVANRPGATPPAASSFGPGG